MKKVLIFFNAEPVKEIRVLQGVNSIRCDRLNGDEVFLKIMSTTCSALHGISRTIYFASDRALTPEEILHAAKKFE